VANKAEDPRRLVLVDEMDTNARRFCTVSLLPTRGEGLKKGSVQPWREHATLLANMSLESL
jgi:hypothetical protein